MPVFDSSMANINDHGTFELEYDYECTVKCWITT